MAPVHKLTAMGSLTSNKVDYPSMLAGYGDFGAMQRIASAVGTGSSNVIEFNNIPQNFQDLFVSIYVNLTATGTVWSYPNGFTASGLFSNTFLIGNGASATSSRDTAQNQLNIIPASSIGSTNPAAITFNLLNYASTSTFKTALTRGAMDQNGSGQTSLAVSLWRNTAAVTSLGFNTFGAANFATSTRISLYGIKSSAA